MGGGSCSDNVFGSDDLLSLPKEPVSAVFFSSPLELRSTEVAPPSVLTEPFLATSEFFSLPDSSGGTTQEALAVSCRPLSPASLVSFTS